MTSLLEFGLGLGLAGSAGLRAYFPLLATGLLIRFSEFPNVKPPFTVLGTIPVLLLLVILAALELMPELYAGPLDEQPLVLPAARGIAGAVLFPAVFSGFGVLLGLIFGGILAVLLHMFSVRAGTARLEEPAAIAGTVLALLAPWSWYIVLAIILFVILKKSGNNFGGFSRQGRQRSWR